MNQGFYAIFSSVMVLGVSSYIVARYLNQREEWIEDKKLEIIRNLAEKKKGLEDCC